MIRRIALFLLASSLANLVEPFRSNQVFHHHASRFAGDLPHVRREEYAATSVQCSPASTDDFRFVSAERLSFAQELTVSKFLEKVRVFICL